MKLYLLRHGPAVERGTPGYKSDADRPLTPKGRRKMRRVAAALRTMGISFDVILSSPLVRARETAEIVARSSRMLKQLKFDQHLAPGGSISGLLREIRGLKPAPQTVLLVGHEPDLGQLASQLLTGGNALPLTLKKGGLCQLTAGRLRPGRCAILDGLFAPDQMELMR